MGCGIEAVDMAGNRRPKAGLTIFESLDNIFYYPCFNCNTAMCLTKDQHKWNVKTPSSLNPTNSNESSNLAYLIPFTYFHKRGQNSAPKIIIRMFIPEWIIKLSGPYYFYLFSQKRTKLLYSCWLPRVSQWTSVMPEPGAGGQGQEGQWPPQYMPDQLTLFEPGRADYPHLLLLAPLMFFTFGHHWL